MAEVACIPAYAMRTWHMGYAFPMVGRQRRVRRAALGSLLIAYIALSPCLAQAHVPVVCPFRRLTDHRCPLCGMTRSLSALVHGDVRASISNHPFGGLVVVGAVWLLASALLPTRIVDR